jgi:hypothetical protein
MVPAMLMIAHAAKKTLSDATPNRKVTSHAAMNVSVMQADRHTQDKPRLPYPPPTCIHLRLQSDSAGVGLSPRTYWGFSRLAKVLHTEMMKGHVYA